MTLPNRLDLSRLGALGHGGALLAMLALAPVAQVEARQAPRRAPPDLTAFELDLDSLSGRIAQGVGGGWIVRSEGRDLSDQVSVLRREAERVFRLREADSALERDYLRRSLENLKRRLNTYEDPHRNLER